LAGRAEREKMGLLNRRSSNIKGYNRDWGVEVKRKFKPG